jgi:hypothetical protein
MDRRYLSLPANRHAFSACQRRPRERQGARRSRDLCIMQRAMISIQSPKGQRIDSIQTWHESAPPTATNHWKPGRSAFELASAWIAGRAADEVQALLEQRAELAPVTLSDGYAERKTRFDKHRGGPRNHDLLVVGTANEQRLVVTVEGKADETFDLPLDRWRARRLKDTAASKGPARLDALTTLFFGTTLDAEPELAQISYQLVSMLAGALADAQTFNARRVVVLIHEFVTPLTTARKHQLNAQAFETFLLRLARGETARSGGEAAWVTEAVEVAGDGAWMPAATAVHFAKLITRSPAN